MRIHEGSGRVTEEWRPWDEEKAQRAEREKHKREFLLNSIQGWPVLWYFFMSLSWKMPFLFSFPPKQTDVSCCFARKPGRL